jgi:hypothetical protein
MRDRVERGIPGTFIDYTVTATGLAKASFIAIAPSWSACRSSSLSTSK